MPNQITILHDSFGRRNGLKKEWGFAALVEHDGRRVLFDAGNDARTFAANTAALEIDLGALDFAVMSHRHGDHTSGITHLLEKNPAVEIFVPLETYGVFGSSLPGSFYPTCPCLPEHMRYYDGDPPATITHGSPWPDAKFTWIERTTEIARGVFAIPVVSDVPGTRELREIALGLRTARGLVVVAGCSHPGIERILEAARPLDERVACIYGGLHLVTTPEAEIRRIALALRERWNVESIAPGHCTGEPGFFVLREVFGESYRYIGLGDTLAFP